MSENIERYLINLREELSESDPATIQDAVSDAEEHLRSALDVLQQAQPDISEADALPAIVEGYGTPEETAAAYRQIEERMRPTLGPQPRSKNRPALARFFGVFADPQAWGALLYLILSLATGVIYFSWAVSGLSVSIGVLVLIIGLPVTVLFMLSVRGLAVVEGRLVEALLGVRMPRRARYTRKDLGWWQRLKPLLFGKRTWLALLYMILQLPLGVIYFTIFVTLIATALGFMAAPIFGPILHMPVATSGNIVYYLPDWATPLLAIGGILLLTVTMHLAKFLGRLHGKLAKGLLVSA
jgi:putative sensor protein